MKQLLIIILICGFSIKTFGQTDKLIITGLVKDNVTGEPLIGANVYCPDNMKGCSTDVYGWFKLEVPKTNIIQLQASFVGYNKLTKEITIPSQSSIITLELTPGVNLEEINVSAIRPIEERMEVSSIEIPIQQIKKMPIFGEPDALKSIQLLPGVQAGADGRSGLYVRGGSPDQNMFLLDGTPVYYINHLGGFISVFHPANLKNVKLYKSGFPARYGGRLSSIVDLRMKEGNKKEHHGSWGVGLVSGDLNLEGPIVKDKTSYLVSYRRVWLDLLTRPITKISFKEFSMGYNFYDFFGKISHEQDNNNRFYFSLYGGDDRLGYNYRMDKGKTKGYTKSIWGNLLSTMRWNHIFSSSMNSDITLYYTRYRYKTAQSFKTENAKGSDIYYTGVNDWGIKADFHHLISNSYTVHFGGGLSLKHFKPGQKHYKRDTSDADINSLIGSQNQTQVSTSFLYCENEFQISKSLLFNIGARISNLNVDQKNYLNLEPRFLGKWNLKDWGTLNFSYSRMKQDVHLVSYSGAFFPTDIWLPSNKIIKPGSADQFSVEYTKTVANGLLELSIGAYNKKLKNQLEVKGGTTLINTNEWYENVEKNGTGTSKGIEFLIQKKQGATTGWISYTFAKSTRSFQNINKGASYPYKYDRTHDCSVVICHQFSKKVDCSATWIIGTGYPTTLYNGKYPTTVQEQWEIKSPTQEVFNIDDEAFIYPGKNWLRLTTYHRLDLGINFHKQKGNKIRTWTIGVYNAYNSQNAAFYMFRHKNGQQDQPLVLKQQSGFPFIPTVKYSVKF